jgi:hypothetical protein
MLHFAQLFGRRHSKDGGVPVIDASPPEAPVADSDQALLQADPARDRVDDPLPPDILVPQSAPTETASAPTTFAMYANGTAPEVLVPAAAVSPLTARLVGIAAAPTPRDAPALHADPIAERRVMPRLIGGVEADLVPVIPNTSVDYQPPDHAPDDEGSAHAAIEALTAASRVLVERVKHLRRISEPIAVVAGLIDLVNELQALYLEDCGIVRGNSLEEVLREVRATISEGDRFILESLEDGRGRLTAAVFVEDMRTIAPSDHSRLIAHYVAFLSSLTLRVLQQYLRPLEGNPARRQIVARRLEYLVNGARDALLLTTNRFAR